MRLGFAVATHLERGRPAPRRGLHRRRRGVPAQVLRQDLRVQVARRDDRVRLACGRRRSRACASARSCCGPAAWLHDGETHEAIAAYHRLLAEDEDPEEREAGLQEWGTRRGARSPRCALEDADGAERRQYLSGEPMVVRLRWSAPGPVAAAAPVARPPRRDRARSSAAAVARPGRARLGRRPASASCVFELPRVPLAEGRFQLARRADRPGERPRLPPPRAGGRVRRRTRRTTRAAPCGSTGSWRLAGSRERSRRAMSSRTCPDWPALLEIAPDLQFKHYTVAEAGLPAEALANIPRRLARRRRHLLRPRPPRLQPRAHRRGRRRGAPGDALVRPARVGHERAGRDPTAVARLSARASNTVYFRPEALRFQASRSAAGAC